MGRQRQYTADAATARAAAAARAGERASIPPPANDNGRPSTARVAAIGFAFVVALVVALLALQPFG